MRKHPNILFIFVDQLRASSLPAYGDAQIATPALDRLQREGMVFDNAISGCPVCTPARAMLVTGRHPQTTGHLMNSVRTRHSEISIADTMNLAGYRTGWIGKWHLHTGVWPALNRMPMHPDWVPTGRDRLGFEYWRAYNQHMVYFDGFVQSGDWNYERWEGYETDGLFKFARAFIEEPDARPFCLFLSPHQPHFTPERFAPERYYERLPATLRLPDNVSENMREKSMEMYRHYLAMTLALDDMVGEALELLERRAILDDTIVVFTSDHGTQGGSQGIAPWMKKMPYEGSIRIPLLVRYPRALKPGTRRDGLVSMVDFFPTLCGLAGVRVPRSVEGRDLSPLWRDEGGRETDSVYLMNFSAAYDWLETGMEWRGVRTKRATYAKWLDGRTELFDLESDPLQMRNLAGTDGARSLESDMAARLEVHMAARGDALSPVCDLRGWHDDQRRVVRNAYGPLSHPESLPDWSLLR
ncbi:MAG: sulfatase [Tagaea sp.]|nr:sulfatase [Tagaea sp.]